MSGPQQAGPPRRRVAGLLLVGLVAAGLVASLVVAVVRLADDSYRAATPDGSVPTGTDPAGAAVVLRELERAAAASDPGAFAALAPDDDPAARELLRAVGRNVAAIGLTDVTARFVDEAGVGADAGWLAEVDLTWRIDGVDDRPATSEVVVTFRDDGERVAITSFEGGEGARTPLWLTGPLAVDRSPAGVVMVAGADADPGPWMQRVRRGVPVVRRVLPGWREPVAVEVPATTTQLDRATASPPGTYAAIAAVVATADGSSGEQAPVRVFANPEVTARLRARGAQVVMTHELVHVATDAVVTQGEVPPWLLEGFADYVALRDVPLPLSTTAAGAAALVRRDGVPDELPDVDALGPRAAGLRAAYELAWLACVVLAEEAGEQALVDTYEAVESGQSPERALREQAGLSVAGLVELWQVRLRGLAS